MTDILLTNDDGYNSTGLYPLLNILSKNYSVAVVAPLEPKSWIGKAITAHDYLAIQKLKIKETEINVLNGSPADCVQYGLYEVLTEKPKLVVAGINTGPNTGHGRILSSGTIGACMEAAIDGVKTVASSLYIPEHIQIDFFDPQNYHYFEQAAQITTKIVTLALEEGFHDDIDILSINIPYGATLASKVEVTVPHKQPYGQLFHTKAESVIHTTPPLVYENLTEGTDLNALHKGNISITPINLDLVSRDSLDHLTKQISKKWLQK